MIKINPNERLGISDCLNHPWFKNEKLNEIQISVITNRHNSKKLSNADEKNNPFSSNIRIKRIQKTTVHNTRSTSMGVGINDMFLNNDSNIPSTQDGKRKNSNIKGIFNFFKKNYFKICQIW